MLDRVVVFVDAGYLFAQGSEELCGAKLPRGSIGLHHEALLSKLKELAEVLSGLPLLRIYWYDGTSEGPTAQHITLANQADVKVRLGFVNRRGEQKGVDSLIVTDMLTLARNRAMAECVLMSGDEDLRVGVQQAQEHGVRVHILGIKSARPNQSPYLLREADSTHEWHAKDLGEFLDCRPSSAFPAEQTTGERETQASDVESAETSSTSGHLRSIARQIAGEVAQAEVRSLVEHIHITNQRPQQIDGKLLADSRRALGYDLDISQKSEVRDAFLQALEERLVSDDG